MSGRLWILFALFIVYATTIPFEFSRDPEFVRHKAAALKWNPLVREDGRRLSIPDAAQNVMLFVPFGVLGAATCRRRWRPGLGRVALVTCAGVGLSLFVETLQIFSTDRVASSSDVMTNGLGAMAGAIAESISRQRAVALMRIYGRSAWMSGTWTYPALVAIGVLFVAAWQPFDLTLDVSTVGSKVRALARNPWQQGPVTDEGSAAVIYALSAMALSKWFEGARTSRPWIKAILVTGALAAGLESSQVLVTSRMPAGSDASVRLFGTGLGALLLPVVQRVRAPRAWLLALLGACLAGAALSAWSPFQVSVERQPFAWVPFLGYYRTNWFAAVGHVIELMLAYFPFGFVLALTAAVRLPVAVAMATTLLAAGAIEYGQSWFVGRHADVTDVAFSVAGGAMGAWFGRRGAAIFERARAAKLS